ncbi:MAG: hypothetical protein II921_08150 [Treponema sp.]|nr:hypothetical protein [Treponema sp.]
MKKSLIVAAGLFLSAALFAVEVNENELRTTAGDSVQFENYAGPHAVIDTAAAIVGIGTGLGAEVARDMETTRTVQPYAKYSVHHVVGAEDAEKLGADILVLNPTAGVDHITNLRRIITGYLSAAYGYEREDAETISVFVTVYNAVYRKDIPYFSSKYNDAVLSYLTEEAAGLSTNWEEWPGKSQIVIPLGEIRAGEEVAISVDTSVISDENVIEAMRSDEDKNIEVRENLTEIKEKESVSASEKAKTAQKEAVQEKKDGNKAAAAESAKTAAEQQKIADKKAEEVRSERETIAKDKAEVKKAEAEKAKAAPQAYTTGLFAVDASSRLYTLMTVNPKNGEVVKKSALRQIREKTIFPVSNVSVTKDDGTQATVSNAFIAICGVSDGKSAVKLCIIDAESLLIQKQSDETISENSPLLQSGDTFFAIVSDGAKNYLASFDKNVSLKTKSNVALSGASPLTITPDGILATDEGGTPVLLSLSGLSSLWAAE